MFGLCETILVKLNGARWLYDVERVSWLVNVDLEGGEKRYDGDFVTGFIFINRWIKKYKKKMKNKLLV